MPMSLGIEQGRTAHFVLACVLAPPAVDAQHRGRLGAHGVNPFEPRVRDVRSRGRVQVLVLGPRTAGEGVADRHDKIVRGLCVRDGGVQK